MANQNIQIENTRLSVWNERDRLHIWLEIVEGEGAGETLLELWDEDARQALEDGFIEARWLKDEDPTLKASAFEYAVQLGRLDPANRVVREPVETEWVLDHETLGVYMGWKAGPQHVWSSDCSEEDFERGAYSFADEGSAMSWFAEDKTSEISMADITPFEIVINPSLPKRPNRIAIESVKEAGIEITRASEASTAPAPPMM
jgi:hypothetical protein